MAKQTIFVGTVPNDNTGDTLRAAMIKVNDNFTELYNIHDGASGAVTVAYGDLGPVSAADQSVFTHNGAEIAFTITTSTANFNTIQLSLSAPSVLLSGSTQGAVVIQRTIAGVTTNIHGIYVSPIDNGYHLTYEDTHNQPAGTEITYKLFNNTGNGGVGGTVSFVTTYGFQFSGREV